MNAMKRLLKSQFGWALVAGAAIGTAATVGFLHSQSTAIAQPGDAPLLSGTAAETLLALDQAGVQLVEKVSPSVVLIRTGRSEGSGVVYRKDGYIMTNAHVVQGATTARVFFNDGREENGRVVVDPNDSFNDIAIIKVERGDLTPAKFADSTLVKPGQIAVAFGAPFGLQESVSFGHVSALGRMNAIPDPSAALQARVYTNMIQTDAAINPGNSGGPLLNYKGEVIGINSAINSTTGYNTGVGFAIPANTAKLIANELIEDGKITRAFLGLQPTALKKFEMDRLKIAGGAIVRSITAGSPADQAGIKVDDVIVKIGEQNIRTDQDVWNAMLSVDPGKPVVVEVVRDGERKNFTARPVERTAELDARGQGLAQAPENLAPERPERGRQLPEQNPDDSSQVRLGVEVRDLRQQELSLAPGGSGVLVTNVQPNSVAARAGVRPGHVITSIGENKIKRAEDLTRALGSYSKGDSTVLSFGREDESGRVQMSTTVRF
jgi:serine protease Do